jgi:F0F1-type ATP synthase assembly protein I
MFIAILVSLLVGFVAGALVFRRHATRLTDLEAKGKAALDALKNR